MVDWYPCSKMTSNDDFPTSESRHTLTSKRRQIVSFFWRLSDVMTSNDEFSTSESRHLTSFIVTIIFPWRFLTTFWRRKVVIWRHLTSDHFWIIILEWKNSVKTILYIFEIICCEKYRNLKFKCGWKHSTQSVIQLHRKVLVGKALKSMIHTTK